MPLPPPTIPAALYPRRDRPGVNRHRDIASGGHSTPPVSSSHPRRFAGSQNVDLGRLGSHTNAPGFPDQLNRTQGQMSRGDAGQRIWKQRGRSPRRRGAEKLQLAVSSGALNPTLVFCADCI
jgi:hypothetical protein